MENSTYTTLISTAITSSVTIIGFIITILINKYNIKKEVSRSHAEYYRKSYSSLEYDVAEILQLAAKDYMPNETVYFPFDIQSHRTDDFLETKDTAERLYRLGGYMSTYGSSQAVKYLNLLKETFNNYKPDKKSDCSCHNDEFCNFATLLALFVIQIKHEIFKPSYSEMVDESLAWLQLRLPVDFFNENKGILTVYIEKNT